ncbi:T9SS type A sorting domain-containing protein [Nonlabens sp.]|uniref:T9SS type A sorting domain-containing protein n=1 Tax=Nonlabens sp. TaxID=1888209 RepID=UPI003F69F8E0
MKKKLLLIALILTSYFSQAQFDVIFKRTNTAITDGQTFDFTESGCGYNDPCNWQFEVTNTSNQDINVRIVVDQMVNNNGSDLQLCFASVCLNSISLNTAYPSQAAVIPVGTTNSVGNYFWNKYPAGTVSPMSWTFRFQAYDANDNEIGTPISMNYNYLGTLSMENSEIPSLNVYPTIVSDELNVSVDENVTATFYDLTGRIVKQVTSITNDQRIDVSNLTSQIYLVHFLNDQNQKTVVKIIKQ